MGRVNALLNPLTFVVVNLAIVAIIWAGGWRVQSGALTQGQIVALVNYMNQILLALVVVANLVVIFTRAAASAARVNEVLDMAPSVTDRAAAAPAAGGGPGTPRVEFDGVDFGYSGGEMCIRDRDGDGAITLEEDELSMAQWVPRGEIAVQPDDFSLTNHMICLFRDGKA